MSKRERIEELKYVLEMYKNTLTILEVWDIEDLRNKIKRAEGELFVLQKDGE